MHPLLTFAFHLETNISILIQFCEPTYQCYRMDYDSMQSYFNQLCLDMLFGNKSLNDEFLSLVNVQIMAVIGRMFICIDSHMYVFIALRIKSNLL